MGQKIVAGFLVMVFVSVLFAITPGAGNVFAGGDEEILKPVEEETIVLNTEKRERNVVWFVLGFLMAVFLTAL